MKRRNRRRAAARVERVHSNYPLSHVDRVEDSPPTPAARLMLAARKLDAAIATSRVTIVRPDRST